MAFPAGPRNRPRLRRNKSSSHAYPPRGSMENQPAARSFAPLPSDPNLAFPALRRPSTTASAAGRTLQTRKPESVLQVFGTVGEMDGGPP